MMQVARPCSAAFRVVVVVHDLRHELRLFDFRYDDEGGDFFAPRVEPYLLRYFRERGALFGVGDYREAPRLAVAAGGRERGGLDAAAEKLGRYGVCFIIAAALAAQRKLAEVFRRAA